MAPPAGDGPRAGAVLGREERDDGTKNLVGEAADVVEHFVAVEVVRRTLAVDWIRFPLLSGRRRRRHFRGGLCVHARA